MVGHILQKKINRILRDKEFGVNILPIITLNELDIATEELSESRLFIQGFNKGAFIDIEILQTLEDVFNLSWDSINCNQLKLEFLEATET